jgi:hypothetical protein
MDSVKPPCRGLIFEILSLYPKYRNSMRSLAKQMSALKRHVTPVLFGPASGQDDKVGGRRFEPRTTQFDQPCPHRRLRSAFAEELARLDYHGHAGDRRQTPSRQERHPQRWQRCRPDNWRQHRLRQQTQSPGCGFEGMVAPRSDLRPVRHGHRNRRWLCCVIPLERRDSLPRRGSAELPQRRNRHGYVLLRSNSPVARCVSGWIGLARIQCTRRLRFSPIFTAAIAGCCDPSE